MNQLMKAWNFLVKVPVTLNVLLPYNISERAERGTEELSICVAIVAFLNFGLSSEIGFRA